ncbi:MAG: NAD(P)H-hydrate epimerase [Actinomycetota bacterium]
MKARSLPTVTADQMREIDRIVVEDLHIDLVQMMENAGRSLAELAIRSFKPDSATVLAGSGGNGGGGMAAARHLVNRGVDVRVILAASEGSLGPVPARQLDILHRMGVVVDTDPREADVVVDAIIGYSLRGDPRDRAAELIEWANEQTAPVLALDVPSGLDASSGSVGSPCVRATATMTLALPKAGLLTAKDHVGRLFLADISVPRPAFERLGIALPALFGFDAVVELE